MFSLGRKESAPLQLYGKLPIAKDYLRVGCSAGNARLLRQWLDEAFSTGADNASQPELAYPMRFLLNATSGPPIQGCLWPSSDAAGLRRFPFVLLVERKPRALLSDLSETGAATAVIWSGLEAARSGMGAAEDGQSLLAAARRRRLALHELEPESLPTVDAVVWAHALWPDEGPRALLPLFAKLREQRGRDPLRLPLVANLPPTVQAHAWWRLLTDGGILRPGSPPSLFFPQGEPEDGSAAFLTVFFGTPRRDDARWLTRRTEGPGLGAGDLVPARPGRAVGGNPGSPDRPLLEGLLHAWNNPGS